MAITATGRIGLAYKTTLFDGQKNLSLTDPAMWSGVLGFENLSGSTSISTATAWSSVGYVARCVDLRANGVAGLPWSVSRGEDITADNNDSSAYPWLGNLYDLLYLTDAALAIGSDGRGQAYWYQVRNQRKQPLSLRWFAPETMTPVWDTSAGLVGFERTIGATTYRYPVEDVPYFAMPNPLHETEPGPSPVATALADIDVMYNLNEFSSKFFERGAIRATILTVEGGIPGDTQKQELKSAWARAMQGLKNAFGVEIFNANVKPETIGDGIGDLDNEALTREKREAISTALGVPHSLVMSNAANFATAEADRLNFYDQTVKPSALRIQTVINETIFEPMGVTFRFAPETLPLYQEDEEQRAQSFAMYVGAGILPSIAAEMLGLTLPQGIEYVDLDPEPTPQTITVLASEPQQIATTADDDEPAKSKAWRNEAGIFKKWCEKRQGRGQRIDVARFRADHLSADDKATIAGEIAGDAAGDDAPFPDEWLSYP